MLFFFSLIFVLTHNLLSEKAAQTPSPTIDYSDEGKITKNGIISICTVVAVGILIIIIGVGCFHRKRNESETKEQTLIPEKEM